MGDAYDEFCERNDLDNGEDHWQEFEDDLADRTEDAQIAKAEARAEALREDMDYDY